MRITIQLDSTIIERAWRKMIVEQDRDPNCMWHEIESLVLEAHDQMKTTTDRCPACGGEHKDNRPIYTPNRGTLLRPCYNEWHFD